MKQGIAEEKPFIKYGNNKTRLEDLKFGKNVQGRGYEYHFNGVYANGRLFPISDSRIAITAVNRAAEKQIIIITKGLIPKFNPATTIDYAGQKILLKTIKKQILECLSKYFNGDSEKISKYVSKFNQLFKVRNKTINAIEFCKEIRAKLIQWNDSMLIMENEHQIFSAAFELSPQDYHLAGYEAQTITMNDFVVKGGVCHHFALTQLNEEEAFDYIFSQDFQNSALYFTDPSNYLCKWGYVLIPQTSNMQNGDLIVYCSSLEYPKPTTVTHFGIIHQGKMISKQGWYPNIMSCQIEDVCIDSGNHYFLFRKSFIPKLISTLVANLRMSRLILPLTGLGIQHRAITQLKHELNQRKQNLLPCSRILNTGRNFLIRYSQHADQLTRQLKRPPQKFNADKVHEDRENSIAELSVLISRLKI